MKKSKMYLLASFLGLIVTTLVVSNIASAAQGEPTGPNFDPVRHEAVQTALENNDYQAWKEAMNSQPRITDYVTEDNFDKFVEMHNLMLAGDREAAEQIRAELGLPGQGKGMMGGFKRGFGMGFKAGHDCPFAEEQ
ncbi:hypothetical protein C4566_03445 [Candidatus Parcubacteria bacterium]|nr:MAG: hypothetical protein C4566_03445 [Candidatus Parcubacteria bacterium]